MFDTLRVWPGDVGKRLGGRNFKKTARCAGEVLMKPHAITASDFKHRSCKHKQEFSPR